MKRFIKYGILLFILVCVMAVGYYLLKKPRQSVLKKVPASVSFCFTLNKSFAWKESDQLLDLLHDSVSAKFRTVVPNKAIFLLKTTGFNPLGDVALFGLKNHFCLAWVGNDKSAFQDTLKKYRWPSRKYPYYEELKIQSDLYLLYKWPVMVLSNGPGSLGADFFDASEPKISKDLLNHPLTQDHVFYGFILPSPERNNWFPMKGKAFAGLKIDKNGMELRLIQPELTLHGKLGPGKKFKGKRACFRWPLNSETLNTFHRIPDTARLQLKQLLTKPFNHVYAEVLDTISFSENIVTYTMDREFELTQKIIDVSKTFPGMYLEFFKKAPETGSEPPALVRPTNLGLDILKLMVAETPQSYIITSERKILRRNYSAMLPDYFLYANLDLLKNDPFWKNILETNYKTLTLHAEALDQGSMFVLRLRK